MPSNMVPQGRRSEHQFTWRFFCLNTQNMRSKDYSLWLFGKPTSKLRIFLLKLKLPHFPKPFSPSSPQFHPPSPSSDLELGTAPMAQIHFRKFALQNCQLRDRGLCRLFCLFFNRLGLTACLPALRMFLLAGLLVC